MGYEILNRETFLAASVLGSRHRCVRLTHVMLGMWCEGNPKLIRKLESTGELMKLLEDLMPDLNRATTERIESSNSHLSDHEILEIAGLPLILRS